MVKFITAAQAAALIPDGAGVGVGGMGLSGWPEEIACALRDRYNATGHPKNLFLHQGCDIGDWAERGVSRLGETEPGMVTRWTCAHMGSAFAMHPHVKNGDIAAWMLPQGVIMNLWRAIGAGRPGVLTKVGLGTFVDPRCGGGRVNSAAKGSFAEVVSFGGEEYLFYKSYNVDVALLRGSVADENGNITFDYESLIHEGYDIANAVHNSGGIVIVQVQYIAKSGTLSPQRVRIPAALVDYVVVATDPRACWQEEKTEFDPSISGQQHKPMRKIPPAPLDERKVIARRCAMELRRGDLINLGVGIPSGVGRILSEENCIGLVTTSAESGAIGGVTSYAPSAAFNSEAFIPHCDMFNLITGGGLDVTILGIGQIDRFGNNNVHQFGGRITGCGGFIDITHATPRLVFCGTLTAKAKLAVHDGVLEILSEGSHRKFVRDVDSVTYAASRCAENQEVLYVTERAVFKLTDGGLTMTEIAPGLDPERDVLSAMDFRPAISPTLREMPSGIFREQWGELRKYIDGIEE
ncbi:MAG: acyl CoA:acetate/3-ketoacid CoA transferase [Oscillospiraceae bacterium]|nr:acyl CoA:acetate/3-ketoacid CoA transferase [Oscillospiraceae bacterium]